MAHYLVQWKLSADNFKSLAQRPENREDIVRQGMEPFGGRLHQFFFAFGDYDGALICEFPDQESCTAFLTMGIAKGGAAGFKTTPLIPAEEARRAFQRAGETKTPYRPALG